MPLDRFLAERRYGLAYRLEQAAGHDGPRTQVLAVAALAEAIRNPAGECGAELAARTAELSRRDVEGDLAAQVLWLAASVRASLLTPPSAVAATVYGLAEMLEALPHLAELARAAVRASSKGLLLVADGVSGAGEYTRLAQSLEAIVDWAREELARPPRGNRLFRGVQIWTEWMAADGLLGSPLRLVADNDRSRLDQVREALGALRPWRRLEETVDAADRRARRPGSERMTGRARRQFLRDVQEVVNQIAEWVDCHERLDAIQPADGRESLLLDLRRQVTQHLEGAREELDELAAGEGPAVAGAVAGVKLSLASTFGLLDNKALPGTEPTPAEALGRELLRAHEVRVVDFAPAEGETLTVRTLLDAAERTWEEAFEARLEADDFVGTNAVCDVVVASGGDSAPLRERHERALRAARTRVERVWKALSARIDASRRQGLLLEEESAGLGGLMERLRVGKRKDLGHLQAHLAAVAARLDDARLGGIERFRTRFEELCAARPEIASIKDRVERLVAAEEIAIAEEFVVLAETHQPLPKEDRPTVSVADFIPAVPDALAGGLSDEVVAACESGGAVGPLGFAAVPQAQRAAVAGWLRAWQSLAGPRRPSDWSSALKDPLWLLGLRCERVETPPGLAGASTRARVWLDAVDVVRTGDAVVHTFGSRTGRRLRLLLCWDTPTPSQLLDTVPSHLGGTAVLVLWFGTMSAGQRLQLAALARARHSGNVGVVDDAVAAFCAARGGGNFEVAMRAVLPFCGVNPYLPDALDDVPEEMFFGRRRERASITGRDGTTFIYGGRRFGKSALLRSAERQFRRVSGHEAMLVPLQHVGATGDASQVWEEVRTRLVQHGIVGDRPRRADAADAAEEVVAGVKAWLAADDRRGLLLLLDECDKFLAADSATGFVDVARLRDLMTDTHKRAKVVFAGLQQVQRYQSIPNQPLSQMSQPLVVGPLAAQAAYSLIDRPLAALGYQFEREDLVNRILTFCNFHPTLLQLFGRELCDRLLARAEVSSGPPWPVHEADVEAVMSSRELQAEFRKRFTLTLDLDKRYKVITYVMAHRAHEEGADASLGEHDLREECGLWWEAGFASLTTDQFRALLEEMTGLGVLACAEAGGYRVRSPNVLRFLGTPAEVLEELEAASAYLVPSPLAAAETRRMLDRARGTYAPVTEAQLADLIGRGRNQCRVVLGSDATAIGRVAGALEDAVRGNPGIQTVVARGLGPYRHALAAVPAGMHRIVLADLHARQVGEGSCAESLAIATGSVPRGRAATRSVVLLAGPGQQPLWRRFLVQEPPRGCASVELRRFDAEGLQSWVTNEELDQLGRAGHARVLGVTGGWLLLIDDLLAAMAGGTSAPAALGRIGESLATPQGARRLVAAAGLDPDPPPRPGAEQGWVPADPELARAWAQIAEHELDGSLEDLAGVIDACADPTAAVASLRALGALAPCASGWRAEPVLAAAWRTAEIGASVRYP